MHTCSAMADGGEAVVEAFGTEDEDDLRLLFSLLGTLSISWDNWEDEEDVMVDEGDLCLADSTGVILAGESLRELPAELWNINTSILKS